MSRHIPHTNDHVLLEYRFLAQAKELWQTRKKTRTSLNNQGWPTDIVEEVVLAIDEACQNIIRHAYHGDCREAITLSIELHGDELVVILKNHAPAVSSDCIKPRAIEDLRPGGLGCHFMRQVMDEVAIRPSPTGQGNILRMVKHVPLEP